MDNMMNEETNHERFYIQPDEYKIEIKGAETEDPVKAIEERNKRLVSEGMEKYMPIGSVLSIKGSYKKYMIIGFNYDDQNGISYDYLGCEYPFGVSSNNAPTLFNHEMIDKVFHIGFINDQERAYKEQMSSHDQNVK